MHLTPRERRDYELFKGVIAPVLDSPVLDFPAILDREVERELDVCREEDLTGNVRDIGYGVLLGIIGRDVNGRFYQDLVTLSIRRKADLPLERVRHAFRAWWKCEGATACSTRILDGIPG